jgi:tetratricopeptide (TPR) repeat protein
VSARLMLEEMGRSVVACSTALDSCGVEMLAGDPEAAERELRRDYQALTEMGERYLLSTLASELARAVYAQGRYDEAFELTQTAEELSAADDITSQALWRMVRGKVLARRGEAEDAAAVVSEAVELMRQTDASVVRDEGLVDVAEAMRLAGQSAVAREYLEEALGLFERNLVSAAAARESLGALAPASAGYTS